MNGAQALIRTLVDAGVDVCFTNPGTSEMHFVAALDDVPEMRGVLGPVRGRRHRRRRRLRPHGRQARPPTLLHLGPGLGNGLANLHNARKGAHADRQHRRRPRHLPQAVRRAARVRHRDASPATCRAGSARSRRTDDVGRRRGRGGRRGARPARAGRHADPARRRVAGRRRRAAPPPAPGRARPPVDADVVDAVAKVLRVAASRPRCSLGGTARAASAALRRRQPHRRRHRRQAARRDVPGPPRARRRPARRRAARLPRRVRRDAARRPAPPRPRRRQGAGVVLRLSRQGERPRARGCEVHVLAGRADDAVGALERARRRASAPPADAATLAAGRPARPARPARSPPTPCARRVGALLPEGAIVSDEAQHSGLFAAGATAGAPPPRLAHASPAARSARACPSPSAPRSPAPTGR